MLDNSPMMRVFFGIPIPEDKVQEYRKLLLKANPNLKHQVRWTRAGNHHITLRFLGNVAKQKIPKLIESVSESIERFSAFEVNLRYITLFSTHHGKFAAANIQPCVELQSLYGAIDLIVTSGGAHPKTRAYMPHITLFRMKGKQSLKLEKIPLGNEYIEVRELILYQSVPIEKGSLYVPLHKLSL